MSNTLAIAFGCFLAKCTLAALSGCNNTHAPVSPSESTQPVSVIQETPVLMNDYEPIPLPRLIGISEYVLLGSVQSIQKETFSFKVEKVLIGNMAKEVLTVAQFIPNKFDGPREAPYQNGQQFLLFLKMDSTQHLLQILGAGGEGEMPVEESFVYFHGRYVEGLEKKNYTVHSKERAIQRFDYKTFEEAVMDFRKCYSYRFDPSVKRYECQKLCGTDEIQRIESKSFIHKHLTDRAK
jgi:hypothetical protein